MPNKSIKCGVDSCKYNSSEQLCQLDSILVGSEFSEASDKSDTECVSFECNE